MRGSHYPVTRHLHVLDQVLSRISRRKYISGAVCASSFLFAGCSETEPEDVVDDWQEERSRGEADILETEVRIDSYGVIEVTYGREWRDALQSVVLDRLDRTSSLAFGFGKDRESEDDEYSILVSREIVLGRDGDIRSKPDVMFVALREATPRAVRATVIYDDTEHTCQFPVYVQDRVFQLD